MLIEPLNNPLGVSPSNGNQGTIWASFPSYQSIITTLNFPIMSGFLVIHDYLHKCDIQFVGVLFGCGVVAVIGVVAIVSVVSVAGVSYCSCCNLCSSCG